MASDPTRQDLDAIDEHGFVVIPVLLGPGELAEIRAALDSWLERPTLGRNNFEGFATQRVYSLVARGAVFERLVEHPRILGVCDALLEQNYLLTASQAIEIHPGETEQPFHADDTFYRIPRPRRAVSISTIFSVDPFTAENGGTQVVRGSHRWDDARLAGFVRELAQEFEPSECARGVPRPAPPLPDSIRGSLENVVMPAGSVIVFLGTLVHRGGANRGSTTRLALSNQYCEPWARPQENFFLSVPRADAARMSERVQALLGYSIHPPFMGHVAGIHPRRTLTRE